MPECCLYLMYPAPRGWQDERMAQQVVVLQVLPQADAKELHTSVRWICQETDLQFNSVQRAHDLL